MADKVYARRISGEEAKERFIFITKDALSKFPSLDVQFRLVFEEQEYTAIISAVSCDCVGTWHEHFHLKVDEWFEKNNIQKGAQIEMSRIDADKYLLETVN